MREVKLTDLETRVFGAWEGMDPDYSGLSFRSVSQRSGVPIPKIRATVRRLARKGLVEFQRGMVTEDGALGGSGYSLTDEGDRLNRLLDEQALAGPLSNPHEGNRND